MSDCVLWARSVNRGGYGRASLRGRSTGAHRVAYEKAFGPIPAGLFVLHRCDNRRCVNPEHLFVGTAKDNTLDAVAKGRLWQPHASGEMAPGAKLSRAEVEAIRASHAGGASIRTLSREYGMARRTVQKIVRHISWTAAVAAP